jgi:hypothetical protein
MRWKLILAALFGIIAFAVFDAAVEAEPSVEGAEVQAPARITVGDRFHFVITLNALNGTRLGVAPGTLPPAFELIGQPRSSTRSAGDGQSQIILDIEIAAFSPGDLVIPPLTLDYEEPDGTRGTVQTPGTRILISSVLPAGGGQVALRDLKPQLEIGVGNAAGTYLAALAAVLIALAVVIALVVRSMRRKPAPVVEVIDTTELGPEDRARVLLEAAGAVFEKDRDYVAYYGAIAVTVRKYLTERYGFHAFALTTSELRNEMNRRGIDRWQSRLIDGLLTQCDAAVYARYVPALERAGHDLNAAFEIVEMSRPKPEPEAAAEEAEAVAAR